MSALGLPCRFETFRSSLADLDGFYFEAHCFHLYGQMVVPETFVQPIANRDKQFRVE